MTPTMVLDLVHVLEDFINQQGPSSIPVHLQILCALRFFAEGGFQKGAQHKTSSTHLANQLLANVWEEW